MGIRHVLLAFALAGCTVGPDFQRPSLWSPSSWFGARPLKPDESLANLSLPANEPVDPEWWAVLDDPMLTGLMRRVAASNLDVRAASFRLAQARARRGIAAADQFPMVNGSGSYTRQRPSDNGAISLFSGGGGASQPSPGTSGAAAGSGAGIPSSSRVGAFDLFQGGFDASWELDLWGRVRRAVEAADANVDASADARRNTLVTSLAEVARDYVQLRGTQETARIVRGNLATARESASLTSERARGGLATDLDVANARAQVEATSAGLPQLEQQEARLVNALSLLLGMPPGALAAELSVPKPVPPVPPRVPVGLPSELARRRPDIRQSEAQLHAATAEIGQAQADFYPRLTLSGNVALQALQFRDLGNWGSRTHSLGPSLSIPIFEGGRLRRTLELRQAQQQEAAVNYQRTVLQAFHEVDDALSAYRTEQQRRERLLAQVQQSRRALGLAQQRFRQGLSDFLEVLTAQRTVLQAEQQLADSTTNVSLNLVQLYKALGGGWEKDSPDQPAGP